MNFSTKFFVLRSVKLLNKCITEQKMRVRQEYLENYSNIMKQNAQKLISCLCEIKWISVYFLKYWFCKD